MAVPAKRPQKKSPGRPEKPLTPLQKLAAGLYADGHSRGQVAILLESRLVSPNIAKRLRDQRLAQARSRLRQWERKQLFRDYIWTATIEKLDTESPAIVRGVLNKARRGRVDAARLALELTGRHNPKGDGAPTEVVIVFNGVPRPQAVKADLEGEVLAEEDE